MNKPLPQPGDTLLSHLGNYTCCTKEFLNETYNLALGYNSVIYGYKPGDNDYGATFVCYHEDEELPPFIQCFKNKPKDKVFFQEVRYDSEGSSTKVSGLDLQQRSRHNTKLTFCGGTGNLKSIELIEDTK
jgi:hypothetical protein